ncbi:hypothetical protein GCM10023195_53690 [Actinoallomurus liliacearum]|uniref:Protein kinase domain-containing protein n=1 Tax=Actinoallomurus liliacearum TaxID=1080073 RepID=A0ABP8TS44_9ACTN
MRDLAEDDPARIGPYQVGALLGESPRAKTYLGFSPRCRAVAIKVVRIEHADDEELRRRLVEAADGPASEARPFTTEVVGAGPLDPAPWVATGFEPGMTLAEMARRGWTLPEPAVPLLAAALATALASAHRTGLVHGALRPSNLLLTATGPRVMDFGTSFTGASDPPRRADDVHDLGGLVALAATGNAEAADGLPPPLREPIARCLQPRPENRPPIRVLAMELGLPEPSPESFHGWLSADLLSIVLDRAASALAVETKPAWRAPPAAPRTPPVVPPPQHQTPLPAALRYRLLRPEPEPAGEPEPSRPRITRRAALAAGAGTAALAAGAAASAALLHHSPRPDQARWSFKTTWIVDSALLVVPEAGVVLVPVTESHYPASGRLIALDLRSGAVRWQRAVKGVVSEWLALTGGRVLACMGESLQMLDCRTGTPLWSVPGLGPGTVATDGRTAYVVGNQVLTAVDLATREIRWRLRGSLSRSATYAGGRLLISIDGQISSVDPRRGTVRWSHESGQYLGAAPVLGGGLVWVGSRVGDLFALDARTGALRHRILTSGDGQGDASSRVALADGLAVVATADFDAFCVDVSTGRVRWKYRTTSADPTGTDGLDSSPVIDAGTVYIGSGVEYFLALDLASGRLKWRFRTGGDVDSSPAVHEDLVYFGSADRRVYAVNKHTGRA